MIDSNVIDSVIEDEEPQSTQSHETCKLMFKIYSIEIFLDFIVNLIAMNHF